MKTTCFYLPGASVSFRQLPGVHFSQKHEKLIFRQLPATSGSFRGRKSLKKLYFLKNTFFYLPAASGSFRQLPATAFSQNAEKTMFRQLPAASGSFRHAKTKKTKNTHKQKPNNSFQRKLQISSALEAKTPMPLFF